jgi:adenylate cyclase
VENEQSNEDVWRAVLNGDVRPLQRHRRIFKWLPTEPRCRFCNAPFAGLGAPIARYVFNKRPSSLNPRFCSACESLAEKHPGGAEIEISMLFADVRGSTGMAEHLRPAEFSRLLNRFYAAATHVLIHADAWVDKLVGDEVIGLFIPGFVGPEHPHVAIHAAQQLLKAVGFGEPNGPWLPIGIGVHTDTVFVGTVGAEGVIDITALGDGMNTTARLVSNAAAGEILVSEAAFKKSRLSIDPLEERELKLKGREEPIRVRVLHADIPLSTSPAA